MLDDNDGVFLIASAQLRITEERFCHVVPKALAYLHSNPSVQKNNKSMAYQLAANIALRSTPLSLPECRVP